MRAALSILQLESAVENLPSYDVQMKKALNRKDFVSVNHRVSP